MIIIRRVLAHVFTIVGKFDSLYCAESARAMGIFSVLINGTSGFRSYVCKKVRLD